MMHVDSDVYCIQRMYDFQSRRPSIILKSTDILKCTKSAESLPNVLTFRTLLMDYIT